MTVRIVTQLPFADYLAHPALGSGSIVTMLRDPFEYWGRYIQGWERASTSAQDLGRIRHTMMLEGPSVFAQRYCVAPDPDDYDALRTMDDYRAALLEIDPDAKKSGTKADVRERLEAAGFDGDFWEDLEPRLIAGRETLSAEIYDEMQRAHDVLEATGIRRGLFGEGWPEVTVFWERGGFACKARLDWFRLINGALAEVDLKTYSNPLGKTSDQIAAHALMYSRYGIQRQWYLQALYAIRDAGSVKVEAGEQTPKAQHQAAEIADAVAAARRDHPKLFPRSIMLFQRTGPIPTPIIRDYADLDVTGAPCRYARRDREDISHALKMLAYYRDEWPDGVPWGQDFRMGIRQYDDTDFAPYYLGDEMEA